MFSNANPNPDYFEYAVVAAEAHMDLLRVRSVRTRLMEAIAPTTSGEIDSAGQEQQNLPKNLLKQLQQIERLDRYERRNLSRRNKALRILALNANASGERKLAEQTQGSNLAERAQSIAV